MDIAGLTPERIAGQRIMAGFSGTKFNSDLAFLIDTLKVGGIILFTRNILSRSQVRRLCSDAQAYASACSQPPLFIAVDQEGGPVARLRPPEFEELPGAAALRTEAEAFSWAEAASRMLADAGFNMNMAPVMDIAPEGAFSIMETRAFGPDPQIVSALGTHIIRQLQKNGIMAVAKHFPGIGRTVLDSHLDLPEADFSEDELESFDLIPFHAARHAGVCGMMLSHIRYRRIDPNWPASLSTKIAHRLLREKLGFDGLVITDDLDMGAIKNHYAIQTVVDRILVSGIDIALICHTRTDMETAFDRILKRSADDAHIRAASIDCAGRILHCKEKFKLTHSASFMFRPEPGKNCGPHYPD